MYGWGNNLSDSSEIPARKVELVKRLLPPVLEQMVHGNVLQAGSYLRFIDSCITQLKAQGPARTCNESKEEEEGNFLSAVDGPASVLEFTYRGTSLIRNRPPP